MWVADSFYWGTQKSKHESKNKLLKNKCSTTLDFPVKELISIFAFYNS
jgi:hypothetical protein